MGANFKFYSAGYPIHSPVEAVLGMKSDYGLDVEEIKSITVRMPSHPASVVNNRSMPTICLQHMVAVALVAGKLGFDEAHSSALQNDPLVLQLKSRVELIGDPEFDREQPQGRGAHVTIETDGQTVSRKIEHPRGHRFRVPAPTWVDVRDKWEELLVKRIGQDRFDDFAHGCAGFGVGRRRQRCQQSARCGDVVMTTFSSLMPPVSASAASPASLLSVNELRKHFPLRGSWPWSKSRGVVKAVDGVSFDLAERETLALVGESGCGKTTTARLLLQLGEPTSGDVTFQGDGIWRLDRTAQRTYRRSVQAVFQDPTSALSPRRRVKKIVTEPLITIEKLGTR